MRHGSLFSGIGGFDLAAEWCGWENVFHCEWNPFGQRVLKHYWPNAESYDDITKTDFTKWRGTVDIVSGGFPCQPYSSAGKRKGKEDERHLWPEMLRAIREIEPSYVVGENVRGLVNWNGGMVFDEVQTDLELTGYEVATFLIPAAGVNAPHGRDRIWFVAYSNGNARQGRSEESRCTERQTNSDGESTFHFRTEPNGNEGNVTDTYGERHTSSRESQSIERNWSRNNVESEKRSQQTERIDGLSGFQSNVTDTCGIGLQCKGQSTQLEGGRFSFNSTQSNQSTWDNFPSESPICGGDDGLSRELDGITFSKWRNESIKAYGNAIVPQVAYQIFQTICKMNHNCKSNA